MGVHDAVKWHLTPLRRGVASEFFLKTFLLIVDKGIFTIYGSARDCEAAVDSPEKGGGQGVLTEGQLG